MFTETFWMETLMSAAITAGATIIGSLISGVIGYFVAISKAKRIIEELPGTLSEKCGNLSKEHSGLSKEHDNLSKEHKELFKEHQEMHKEFFKEFSALDKGINEIKSFQTKEEAVRQEASKHLPQETQLEVLVKQVFENNNALINEKHSLENKILLMEQQISNLQKELSEEKNKALEANLKLHVSEKTKHQNYDEYEL